ncbi:hypothetical protein AC578_9743 [Pseudocercospora eumusae]|uniref:AB hydrolase-1 domain-containing protein n=1 Tax=Pseudocercospora eumusae TaxID=321146 RepID=A0A139HQN2_9PEZI|nr:hypothetical protein AC578_9743 [Pseudocercospora eumusae]
MAETLPSRFNNLWRLPSALVQYLTSIAASNPPADQLILDRSKPCLYRIDTETSATITLRDGRKLGYAEYGSPHGRVIFCLHGLPGARTEAAMWDQIAVDVGARLISVDRPGIGWSSPQPGRRLLDHAKDIEQLAEHLRLDEYAVMGSSAGGPYALGCAYALPADRLKAVALVVGLGSPEMHGWKNYLGWCACKYVPSLPKWFFSRDAAARLDLSDEERYSIISRAPEARKTPEILRLFVQRTSREIFAQGAQGLVDDAKTLGEDWGFRVEDIRKDLPVQLWYGKRDLVAPVAHGELYAARLGGNATLRVEDENHGSMIQNWEREIQKALLAVM